MSTFEVTVSQLVEANAEAIYDTWLDPRRFGAWHGGPAATLDATVGGLYHFAVEYEGQVWHHYGRFVRLERPTLIEQTWMSGGTLGLDSVVTVRLEPRGEQTEVTLRHSGLPDEHWAEQHRLGWAELLASMAQTVNAAG